MAACRSTAATSCAADSGASSTFGQERLSSITATSGAFVQKVQSGSGAEAAGLQAGDVITAVNDEPVADLDDMFTALERFRPGERVTLTLWRAGQTRKVAVALE